MNNFNINNISVGKSYASNMISYLPADETKVLKDLENKITTFKSPDIAEPNSAAFIKEVILPPFLDLYKNWPAGYKLLMSNNLSINVIKFKDNFHFDFESDAKVRNRVAGCCAAESINKNAILINRYDTYYSHSYFKKTVYHEIMHGIDHLAVKDKNGKFLRLSEYLDEKYKAKGEKKSKLTRICEKYMKNLNEAIKEISDNYDKNGELNPDSTRKIMNKHGCWAYSETGQFLGLDDMIFHFSSAPKKPGELLAWALQIYFGTKEEKERLKNMDPWLYGLIEKEVLPAVNRNI